MRFQSEIALFSNFSDVVFTGIKKDLRPIIRQTHDPSKRGNETNETSDILTILRLKKVQSRRIIGLRRIIY